MEILFSLTVSLIAGLLMSRVIKPTGLPAVTSYLIAGIIVGPFVLGQLGVDGLGFTSIESVSKMDLVCDVALGFIAFTIGNEFKLPQLRLYGKSTFVIGILEALMATVLVDIALITIHNMHPEILSFEAAITLGAIAAATAPAATLMVIKQYKAKGKMTSLLYTIVALDDAIGLIIFAVSFGIAKSMGSGEINTFNIIVEPIIEIIGSLLIGALMGFILSKTEKLFNSNSKRLAMTIAFVFLTVSIAKLQFNVGNIKISFSPLLVCMMLGTVFCNICNYSDELMDKTNKWTTPLFILFFVFSGASLQLDVIMNIPVLIVGIVYIVVRVVGKYVGAYIGSTATHCDDKIRKNLGIALFPQAGVALGMSLMAYELDGSGTLIRNIVLFAVLIYELIGPVLTKTALKRAGEISPVPEEVLNRRKTNQNA